MKPLSDEDIWGLPITEPAPNSPGPEDDNYKCPECGFFTPGYHAKECGVGRHSA